MSVNSYKYRQSFVGRNTYKTRGSCSVILRLESPRLFSVLMAIASVLHVHYLTRLSGLRCLSVASASKLQGFRISLKIRILGESISKGGGLSSDSFRRLSPRLWRSMNPRSRIGKRTGQIRLFGVCQRSTHSWATVHRLAGQGLWAGSYSDSGKLEG